MLSKVRVIIVLVLIAFTWYAMQYTAEVKLIPIKKTLSSFPHTIGEYSLSNSLQSSAEVVEMLGVDDYIQYNYVRADGHRINFYVGYYQAVGVTGIYHSPKNCIPGGGWGIDVVNSRSLDVGLSGESKATVSEMIIRRGNEFQMVYYWYQNRGRVIASEYMEKVYQVLDALFKRRRDGAFVRIITMVDGMDFPAAEKSLQDFSERAMVELDNYLPGAQL